ncbi:RNA polymerase II transcription factor SIII subunit A-domain-containing protein [Tirmania nivea]|nr:RNA polymerase II transcription factor SIII subunit A-domain-containing protein [Tirmania nivea]
MRKHILPSARKSEPTSPTQIYPVPANHVGAPSLFQLATKLLIKRVHEIDSVGPLLFPHVEPILRNVKYAPQLRLIEQNSPQVAGKLPELWKLFIARDFGADPEKYFPENPKNWHKIYAKHGREFDDATSSAANQLKDQLSALSAQKAKLRPTELTGSAAARLAPKPSSWGSGWGRSGWAVSGDGWNTAHGSKTKDVMRRIKREVGNKKRKLTTPTHELNARRGGGWGGGKGGLNREMVEKLRRDATMVVSGGLVEERKKMDTEEERDRRFRMETAKRLGERRISSLSINPLGPTGVVKRPSAPVISKTPAPLPSRALVKKGPEKLMQPPKLSQLTRRWGNPVTAGAAAAAGLSSFGPSINTNTATNRTISLASAAQPQGIRKQQSPPPSTAARTNTSPAASSAFLTSLRKLANSTSAAESSSTSSGPSSRPQPTDSLLDPLHVTTNNTTNINRNTTKGSNSTESRNNWPGMGKPQKKLIPIVRPRREPNLFVVRKPVRSGAGVGAGEAGSGVGAGRSGARGGR